jgi:hypothetical protein
MLFKSKYFFETTTFKDSFPAFIKHFCPRSGKEEGEDLERSHSDSQGEEEASLSNVIIRAF